MQPSSHAFLEICLDDAYNGGGSLQMKNICVSLFKCDIVMKRCIYAITYKSRNNSSNNKKLTSIFHYELNDQNRSKPLSIAINFNELNNEDFKVECIK